jgi:hypothetical protein
MDILESDLMDFWRELNKNQVKYIMIGGFAVNMQGYSRATKDVDWYESYPPQPQPPLLPL